MFRMEELLDLNCSLLGGYLAGFLFPWEALSSLGTAIRALGENLGRDYRQEAPGIWVHRTARVASNTCLEGCCILGPGAQVRHGGYLRGSVLLGENALVGNSSEVKNAVFFDGAKAPHYNYVGDSILGRDAHLGAGTILSNLKSDQSSVTVLWEGQKLYTGLRKCGSFLGDGAEVGCGSVLNPGSVLGRNARVYPLCSVRFGVPEGYILKSSGLVKLHPDGRGRGD